MKENWDELDYSSREILLRLSLSFQLLSLSLMRRPATAPPLFVQALTDPPPLERLRVSHG
jgi:hypothetical protein